MPEKFVRNSKYIEVKDSQRTGMLKNTGRGETQEEELKEKG